MEGKSNVGFAGGSNPQLRVLHWSTVVGVVLAEITAYYRHWYTTQTETINWYLLIIHMNVGVVVLLLSCTMLILRFRLVKIAQKQKTDHFTSAKLISAKILHFTLYGMLIVMPISAYIGIGFDLPLFGIVTLPSFVSLEFVQQWVEQSLDMLIITFLEPFAKFHRDIGADIILPILLLVHIGAAIYNLKTQQSIKNTIDSLMK